MEFYFLQKLAKHVTTTYPEGLDELCFVFPSRRAGLFFKRELAKIKRSTFWAPEVLTIPEFIEDLSGYRVLGSLEQLFWMYEIHIQSDISPKLSFENFVDFGKTALGDFNDIDMAMADSKQLFNNVTEFLKINFDQDLEQPLTSEFLNSFNHLITYYEKFEAKAIDQNRGYQGLIYRLLIEAIKSKKITINHPNLVKRKKIFVAGLNALTPAESWVFNWLESNDKLELFFEAEAQMIQDTDQESGLFIRDIYKQNPAGFKWMSHHLSSGSKRISTYAVSGDIGMSRLVGNLFQDGSKLNPEETAIILADEGLLLPVLESLPTSIGPMNVTLGLPLGKTTFMTFVEQVFQLQIMAREGNKGTRFYHKDFLKVLTNPILQIVTSDELSISTLGDYFVKENVIHFTTSDIQFIENKETLHFLVEDLCGDWKRHPLDSISFFEKVIHKYEQKMAHMKFADDLLTEQLYFFRRALNQLTEFLAQYDLNLSLEGVKRVFTQIISNLEVPYSGEPLVGVQILGLLETRLLSFKNVVFLSVNEGKLPAKAGSQTFLPQNLRSAFGIQTNQHKESIFAYHFYRILSQAENVHLIYDTANEGVGSKEPSRFIRQIEKEWPLINPAIQFDQFTGVMENDGQSHNEEMLKSPEVLANIVRYLTERGLSPSALNTYLESPIDFYFKNVLGVQEVEKVDEDVEHNVFGTIVHECLEYYYQDFEGRVLSAEELKQKKSVLNQIIDERCTNMLHDFKEGKAYLSHYSIKTYVHNFVNWDIERVEKSKFPITLIKNELRLNREIEIKGLKVKVKGFADRVEKSQGIFHVVDYKTGKVSASDVKVNSYEDLKEKHKPKAIQLLLYAWMAAQQLETKQVVSSIISFRDVPFKFLKSNYLGKNVFESDDLVDVESFLIDIVEDMLNVDKNLTRDPDYIYGLFQ